MIQTTNMGLKLPDDNDFYNIDDANQNFTLLENALAALTERVSLLESGIVTGVVESNGAVELGFEPKLVIVMATVIDTRSRSLGNLNTVMSWGGSMAIAFPGKPQYGALGSESGVVLEVTPIGFFTNLIFGKISIEPDYQQLPSAETPLRYIAFK